MNIPGNMNMGFLCLITVLSDLRYAYLCVCLVDCVTVTSWCIRFVISFCYSDREVRLF